MTATGTPRVVHSLPGRLRIHAPEWAQAPPGRLEGQLRSLPGVEGVRASATTGNVLVTFDPVRLGRDRILDALADGAGSGGPAPEPSAPPPPGLVRRGSGSHDRARISVRGLDRDPQLARRVEERLEARPEVERAEASPITGRVLVEFSRRVTDLDDLLNEVANSSWHRAPGRTVQSIRSTRDRSSRALHG